MYCRAYIWDAAAGWAAGKGGWAGWECRGGSVRAVALTLSVWHGELGPRAPESFR